MKNLENFGVTELSVESAQEVNGGFLLFLLGFVIGAGLVGMIWQK